LRKLKDNFISPLIQYPATSIIPYNYRI
jgi:hypothetical protein